MVEAKDAVGESQIRKMFAGATVFLTGGTGFLGKLIVEKLLRSCPDIKKLYILARPKKNKDIAKRIEEQFEDVLYNKLKKEMPDFFQKIAVVEGDVSYLGLGIREQDRINLINEVEFIFHGAATVRFDEPLKRAVEINVKGTREMFKLARQCGKLRAFVHISTVYSNCVSAVIDEKFYDSIMPGDMLIDLVETMDENTLKNITLGLIGKYPNTYTFTKSIAENIVAEYSKGLPVAVFRPAIVVSTAKEPVAGWIDNFYGPSGLVAGGIIGLLHTMYLDPTVSADFVPGDMVVNACIACAWKTAKDHYNYIVLPQQELRPLIYNYVPSDQKLLKLEDFIKYIKDYGREVPPVNVMYYHLFWGTSSRFIYHLYAFFLHWIPAYTVDAASLLIGKKPMLRKVYKKISMVIDILLQFSTNQFKFSNKNVNCLFSEMCDTDKQIFNFDMSGLDWDDYLYNYVCGIRVHLLKDPLHTVPEGQRKLQKLKYIHYFLCSLVTFVAFGSLWGVIKFVCTLKWGIEQQKRYNI